MARPMARPATKSLYDSFIALSRAWPVDPLRPNASFGTAIRTAANEAFLVRPSEATAEAGTAEPAGGFKQLGERQEKAAQAALKALESIRNGDASKKYPTPQSILKPASHPDYYDRIVRTLDQAAQGKNVGLSFRQRFDMFMGRK